MAKQEGTHIGLWDGSPVFWTASHIDRDEVSRVFHRDKPGWKVAEFFGPAHREMADKFCELFGQRNGCKQIQGQRCNI